MSDSIYKIFQPREWEGFTRTSVFNGSVHDRRDGFIHLCAAHQLSATLSKHYKDVQKIVLARFAESALAGVKWEVSRGGEKFPHVYGTLAFAHLQSHMHLTKSTTGKFVLPENLTETP